MTPREELDRLRKEKRLQELEAKAQPKPMSAMDTAVGAIGTVGQGVTLRWGDELGAAIGAPVRVATGQADTLREGFGQAHDASMREIDAFRGQHPKTAIGLEVAGGVLPALGLLATGNAGAVAGAARESLPVMMRNGAFWGMGLGTVGGAGDGDTLNERATNAAFGGALGFGLGGVAPLAAKGVGAGVNVVRDALMRSGRAAELGVRPATEGILRQSLRADGSLDGAGAANIAAAGPDAMLADAGPNARSILDTAVQRSGRGGAVAREAIEGRASSARAAMDAAMDRTFGPTGRFPDASAETRAAMRAAYTNAYATPINYAGERGRQLEQLLKRVPEPIINRANQLMRVEGEESAQILASLADDGSITYQRLPDVRQLDYITRTLQSVARRGDGQGLLGGNTPEGRAFGNLAREIRNTMRAEVPAYGKALDTASTEIGKKEAREFGGSLLSRSVTREQAAEEIAGMSQIEKEYAKLGVRAQFDDLLANTQRAVTDGNMDAREAVAGLRLLSSRANKEKVATLVGEESANELFDQMNQAVMAMELRAAVAQNSKTFARTAMDDAVRAQTDDGAVNALMSGQPLNTMQRIVQALSGRTQADKQRIYDQTYEELARLLTQPRGQDALATFRNLQTARPEIPPAAFTAPPKVAGSISGVDWRRQQQPTGGR